jgi:hypothetical protein
MQVESIPLTPENLWMCVPLWGGGETYAGQEMQAVLDGASRLLSERRALGAIVLENERARAFGVTTFADEAVVDGYLADPQPHLGKRLLVDAQAPDSTSVLPVSGIAERNAGAGLQVVVANTACDTGARDGATVLGVLMRAFHDIHRGYRIGRIVIEVFGENAISALMRSSSFEVLRILNVPAASRQLRSLVGTLTREQAVASTLPLLAMFAYSPPRFLYDGRTGTAIGGPRRSHGRDVEQAVADPVERRQGTLDSSPGTGGAEGAPSVQGCACTAVRRTWCPEASPDPPVCAAASVGAHPVCPNAGAAAAASRRLS